MKAFIAIPTWMAYRLDSDETERPREVPRTDAHGNLGPFHWRHLLLNREAPRPGRRARTILHPDTPESPIGIPRRSLQPPDIVCHNRRLLFQGKARRGPAGTGPPGSRRSHPVGRCNVGLFTGPVFPYHATGQNRGRIPNTHFNRSPDRRPFRSRCAGAQILYGRQPNR